MTSALNRLRVVDFTTTIAGPHCTRLLADLGAEVIKIEAPEAVAAAHRLIATADVLVENFRPGVMQRFGLDYPNLRSLKPGLIYCAISGYGQTGPSAGLPAYAPVIHAASGYDLAHLAYQEGERRPDYCGIYIADVLTGTYAFGAILAALHQRHATGEGQMIDVSMLESMLSLTLTEIQLAQFPESYIPGRPVFGPIVTKDGYVNLSIASERTFQNLAAACGRPDWLTDSRFARYLDRRANWGQLIEEVEAWSGQLTSAEVQTVFDRHGVPASPYRTVAEALDDPQLQHRRSLTEVHDRGGTFRALNPPFRFSSTPAAAQPFVSALGEHTEAILGDLGYAATDIAALAETGAIGLAAAS